MSPSKTALGTFWVLAFLVVSSYAIEDLNEPKEDKRANEFDRILRSSEFDRILRSGEPSSFSRILRSPEMDESYEEQDADKRSAPRSFSRILRSGPNSFSRILRSTFSRILKRGGGSPSTFSRILKKQSPSSFSRILRDPDTFSRILRSSSYPSSHQTYERSMRDQHFSRILKKSDPMSTQDEFYEEGPYEEEGYERPVQDFSRFLRSASFSRILR